MAVSFKTAVLCNALSIGTVTSWNDPSIDQHGQRIGQTTLKEDPWVIKWREAQRRNALLPLKKWVGKPPNFRTFHRKYGRENHIDSYETQGHPSLLDPWHLVYHSPSTSDGSIESGMSAMIQMFVVFFVLMGVVLAVCFTRRRCRSQRSAQLVRANVDASGTGGEDFDDSEPEWIRATSQISKQYISIGWDRRNMGQFISATNSRSLHVSCLYQEQLGTDGAIFDKGFTSGKHVFAVMWPRDMRIYYEARLVVGIGFDMEMHTEYGHILVGGNDISFGLDFINNKLWYDRWDVGRYPRDVPYDYCFPTLVYMYLDLDEDRLSFGTETEFFGVAFDFKGIRNLKPRTLPMYPMVAFRKINGRFMIFYKGEVHESSIKQTKTVVDIATTSLTELNAESSSKALDTIQEDANEPQTVSLNSDAPSTRRPKLGYINASYTSFEM